MLFIDTLFKMNYFLLPTLNKNKDMHIWHYLLCALFLQVITITKKCTNSDQKSYIRYKIPICLSTWAPSSGNLKYQGLQGPTRHSWYYRTKTLKCHNYKITRFVDFKIDERLRCRQESKVLRNYTPHTLTNIWIIPVWSKTI